MAGLYEARPRPPTSGVANTRPANVRVQVPIPCAPRQTDTELLRLTPRTGQAPRPQARPRRAEAVPWPCRGRSGRSGRCLDRVDRVVSSFCTRSRRLAPLAALRSVSSLAALAAGRSSPRAESSGTLVVRVARAIIDRVRFTLVYDGLLPSRQRGVSPVTSHLGTSNPEVEEQPRSRVESFEYLDSQMGG